MTVLGPFRREEATHQTVATAKLQVQSGEIWGLTPQGGMEPTVQAYRGKLASGKRGVEFTTNIPPHPFQSPYEARWYLTQTPGVQKRECNNKVYAAISADVVNLQP